MAEIGLNALLKTQSFQAGLNIYMKGVAQATGATKAAAGQMGGINTAGIAVGTMLGNIGAKMVEFAIQGIGSLVTNGVRAVSTMQDLTIQLEALATREIMMSGITSDYATASELAVGVAARLTDKLKLLSIQSPFQFQDIMASYNMAVAYGVTSDKAIDLTRAITNVAAVNKGIPGVLQKITYGLSQMSATGVITTMDIRQMSNAGVNMAQVFSEGMGKSIKEVQEGLQNGSITMEEVGQAFILYSDKYYGEAAKKASRSIGGLASSFKDLAFFASNDILGPSFKIIGEGLGNILDKGTQLLSSGMFQQIGAGLSVITGEAMKMASNAMPAITGFFTEVGNTLAGVADKALTWGYNIISELAIGIMQGISTVLTQAMNMLSSVLAYFLQAMSPPRVAPDIDKWGAATMNEYLGGFAKADFSMLDAIQAPMRQAFQLLEQSGSLGAGGGSTMFANMSEEIATAIAEFNETGKVAEGLYAKLSKAGGAYGENLAELLRRQFALKSATDKLTAAEKAAADAKEAQTAASAQVNAETKKYNDMLRGGATSEELAAQLAKINNAETEREQATVALTDAEKAAEQAKEDVALLEEQVALQDQLIQQQLELAQARQQAADAAKAAAQAASAGGGGGGGGVTFPPVPPPDTTAVTGAFEELKGKIGLKIDEIKGKIEEKWKEIQKRVKFDELITSFTNFADIAGKVITKVMEFLSSPSGKSLVNSIGKVLGYIIGFKLAWGAVMIVLRPFIGIITTVVGVFGKVLSVVGAVGGKLGAVRLVIVRILQAIAMTFGSTALAVAALFIAVGVLVYLIIRHWKTLKAQAEAFGKMIVALFGWIARHAKQIWNDIREAIGKAVNAIVKWVTTAIGNVRDWLSTAWTNISNTVTSVWDAITNWISTALTNIYNWVVTAIGNVSTWLDTAWATISGAVSTVWNAILTVISTIINTVSTVVTTVINTLSGVWSTVWNTVSTTASTIWTTIQTAIETAINTISTTINTILTTISTTWSTIWTTISTTVSTIWTTITTTVSTTLATLATTISTAITGIFTDISSFITTAYNFGRDLILGMIDGVKDFAQQMIDAVLGPIQDALDAVGDLLGIGSPSKVFANIGKMTMLGFGEGIKVGSIKPMQAMQQATVATTMMAAPINYNSYSTQQSVNLGGVNVSNGMNQAQAEAWVIKTVQKAMKN